jgi:UDP-N-acetylmuramate--alanine ligase
VVYLQPHTYSRTRALLGEWATAFGDADVVRIGDIYAARETDTLGIDSATLARRIDHPDCRAVGGMTHAIEALHVLLKPGDVLLTLGAGDGYKVGEVILEGLEVKDRG